MLQTTISFIDDDNVWAISSFSNVTSFFAFSVVDYSKCVKKISPRGT